MSLGTSQTIGSLTFDRISSSENKSRFFQRDASAERYLDFTHSVENRKLNGNTMERHTVKYSKRIFATADDPEYWEEVWTTIRCPSSQAITMWDNVQTLVSWISDGSTILEADLDNAKALANFAT